MIMNDMSKQKLFEIIMISVFWIIVFNWSSISYFWVRKDKILVTGQAGNRYHVHITTRPCSISWPDSWG